LPFALVDTDLSFWQENPGDWRIRLKGEPSRTDQSLELSGSGDTGVVRLTASEVIGFGRKVRPAKPKPNR